MRDHIFSLANSLSREAVSKVLIRAYTPAASVCRGLVEWLHRPDSWSLSGDTLVRTKRGVLHIYRNLLLLSDPFSESPEAVCHDPGDSDQVVCGPEASGGQVAAVLHGLVAAGRRHVLRHDGGDATCVGELIAKQPG